MYRKNGWFSCFTLSSALTASKVSASVKVSTAYVMFYVYAALMGFTLSTIFMAYDLVSLSACTTSRI